MDQKINAYLESLVLETLNYPAFSNLSGEQKSAMAEKIRNHLYNTIFDTIIDRLDAEQLNAIKDLPMDSPEMEAKITEYAAFIPNLAQDLEAKLNQEVANIKQNPQILNQNDY